MQDKQLWEKVSKDKNLSNVIKAKSEAKIPLWALSYDVSVKNKFFNAGVPMAKLQEDKKIYKKGLVSLRKKMGSEFVLPKETSLKIDAAKLAFKINQR